LKDNSIGDGAILAVGGALNCLDDDVDVDLIIVGTPPHPFPEHLAE
jgi:hypothetical protein